MVESASASDATDTKDILERDIGYLLNRANLQKHRDTFIRLGVVKVKHFVDVADGNLESEVVRVIGLSTMEAELLKRNFSEIQAESQQQDLDGTGKSAFCKLLIFRTKFLVIIKYHNSIDGHFRRNPPF